MDIYRNGYNRFTPYITDIYKKGYDKFNPYVIKKVTNIKNFTTNKSNRKLLISIILIFIILLVILIVYLIKLKRYNRLMRHINCGNCSRFIKDGLDGLNPKTISPVSLKQPNDNDTASWCFWMNINEWYYRYNKWKNIAIKGSTLESEDRLKWDDIPKQCPGIWMTPKHNNLRIVFNTNLLNKTTNNYLEFCQINNIPIGKWFHISIILIDKSVEIYLNGLLVRTCIFKGKPEFNKGPLQLCYLGGFQGNLKNFRYVSSQLYPEEVNLLYKRGKDEKGFFTIDNLDDYIPRIEFGPEEDCN